LLITNGIFGYVSGWRYFAMGFDTVTAGRKRLMEVITA
jgi:hypothetical protein